MTISKFRPHYRDADPLGPGGGDQNSKESHRIWSASFWHSRSPYICLPACTAFLGHFVNVLADIGGGCMFEADADP